MTEPMDPVNRSKLKLLIDECQHALGCMPGGVEHERMIKYAAVNNNKPVIIL